MLSDLLGRQASEERPALPGQSALRARTVLKDQEARQVRLARVGLLVQKVRRAPKVQLDQLVVPDLQGHLAEGVLPVKADQQEQWAVLDLWDQLVFLV